VSARLVFVILAAAVLGVVLITAVVRPAVERGGFGELVALAAVVAAVLLAERWLRGR
jgi:hypothetical protein